MVGPTSAKAEIPLLTGTTLSILPLGHRALVRSHFEPYIQADRASDDAALRDIPAAALTAYARSEDRAKALQGGFEIHLAKPIDPTELISAVQALARRRHIPTDSK